MKDYDVTESITFIHEIENEDTYEIEDIFYNKKFTLAIPANIEEVDDYRDDVVGQKIHVLHEEKDLFKIYYKQLLGQGIYGKVYNAIQIETISGEDTEPQEYNLSVFENGYAVYSGGEEVIRNNVGMGMGIGMGWSETEFTTSNDLSTINVTEIVCKVMPSEIYPQAGEPVQLEYWVSNKTTALGFTLDIYGTVQIININLFNSLFDSLQDAEVGVTYYLMYINDKPFTIESAADILTYTLGQECRINPKYDGIRLIFQSENEYKQNEWKTLKQLNKLQDETDCNSYFVKLLKGPCQYVAPMEEYPKQTTLPGKEYMTNCHAYKFAFFEKVYEFDIDLYYDYLDKIAEIDNLDKVYLLQSRLCYQLLDAVLKMQQNQILHNDLHDQNIMLNKECNECFQLYSTSQDDYTQSRTDDNESDFAIIKIIDFGKATMESQNSQNYADFINICEYIRDYIIHIGHPNTPNYKQKLDKYCEDYPFFNNFFTKLQYFFTKLDSPESIGIIIIELIRLCKEWILDAQTRMENKGI